eukprot:SAG22_NODE_3018_length_2021_cov_1.543704_1_plen_425_part_10
MPAAATEADALMQARSAKIQPQHRRRLQALVRGTRAAAGAEAADAAPGPCVVVTELAAGAGAAGAAPIVVPELVFLSHPFAWELQAEELGKDHTWGGFTLAELIAMEQEVSARWIPAVRSLGRGAALLINHMVPEEEVVHGSGPSSLLSRAARSHLGERQVVELYLAAPTNAAGAEAAEMLAARGVSFDPETVATEAWGQSTEGCVQWFASHFAVGLGLPRGFPLRYELTFPDAPFCMRGQFVERLPLRSSRSRSSSSFSPTDVSAYLFRSAAGQPFALVVPGVMRDDQGPRQVRLQAPVGAISFSNKLGDPLAVGRVARHGEGEGGEWTAAGEQLCDWIFTLPNHTANRAGDTEVPWDEVGFVWGRAGSTAAAGELELRRMLAGADVLEEAAAPVVVAAASSPPPPPPPPPPSDSSSSGGGGGG